MEMQQMMERLLAKMDANQPEMRANRKANQDILVRMEANRERDREKNLKDLKEDIKSSQADVRSILNAWITDIKDARKRTTACQEVTEPVQRRWSQIQEKRRP
jgi:hypothetical protein